MATITSTDFDAADAGFNELSSDTTRVYYDASLTIDAEGEPSVSTERTDFQGAFTDTLPFTLVTSAVSVGTTELNTMRNGTIITTNGAAGFGNSADYTFRAACNIDWDNMNFMCSNGLVNGFGVAGSGATVRPLGRVVNSTFGTTATAAGALPDADASFTTNTYDTGGTVGNNAGEWLYDPDCTFNTAPPAGSTTITIANLVGQCFHHPYESFGLGANPATDDAFLDTLTWVVVHTTAGDITMNIGSRAEPSSNDSQWTIISVTSDLTTTTGNDMTNVVWDWYTEEPIPAAGGPAGNWFVNLANVDASFVFANNALDAAVLNTAAAGNYVVGLAFAGTVRQQSAGNNSYTIRINAFARAYEGETNESPWTLVMNNRFANNATTPYAAGVGNAAIAHYETNNVPTGSTILMVNEQFEGDAFFAAKRTGISATFVSTYSWNPTFITPASATIADAKLVGVGSDVIYQVPTGTTNRVSTFATQYPTITDGTIVNSSNGYLVQAGSLAISPNNATTLEGTAARAFADGSLLVTPVTKRAKSYTHLVDTVVTSEIDAIENSGGNNGSFTFTESSATTADVDTSLIAGTATAANALNGSQVIHNEGAALYSRLKADWYLTDTLNEPLTSFAGTATAGTISSIHNINLSNTVASASVDATGGIVLPASAGITGDSTFNHISTTGNISVGVACTDMSLTGAVVSIAAVAISGGTLSGSLDVTDGASFSLVTFDGTLNSFTGTSLDLSNVRFGDDFAATAGSGTGKTVTIPSDTSRRSPDYIYRCWLDSGIPCDYRNLSYSTTT